MAVASGGWSSTCNVAHLSPGLRPAGLGREHARGQGRVARAGNGGADPGRGSRFSNRGNCILSLGDQGIIIFGSCSAQRLPQRESGWCERACAAGSRRRPAVAGVAGVVAGMVGIVRPDAFVPLPYLLSLLWLIVLGIVAATEPLAESRPKVMPGPQNEGVSTSHGAAVAAKKKKKKKKAEKNGIVAPALCWLHSNTTASVPRRGSTCPLAIGFSTVAAGMLVNPSAHHRDSTARCA